MFPPINEFVIKLASRCNIKCTYCYWFEDETVLHSPKVLTLEAENAFVFRLDEHIREYGLRTLHIAFHGGEPALFPVSRMKSFCLKLRQLELTHGCKLSMSMQTNGLLLDEKWFALIKQYQITLGLSLDGDKLLHDKYRIDNKGRGTYQRTVSILQNLRQANIPTYVLTVVDPETKPEKLLEHLAGELSVRDFDILLPHLHHNSDIDSEWISKMPRYLSRLFDIYVEKWLVEGVNIRFFDELMALIISNRSATQGWGYISTATLMTDGELQAIDDLRMAPVDMTSECNVLREPLQSLTKNSVWREIYQQSLELPDLCNSCELVNVCGGGPLISRWSSANRFNNVNLYCQSYKYLIKHIKQVINPIINQLKMNVRPFDGEPQSTNELQTLDTMNVS